VWRIRANSFELGIADNFFNVAPEVFVLRAAGASHNALQRIVGFISQCQHITRSDHLSLIYVSFDVDGLHYIEAGGRGKIVLHRKRTIQARLRRHPRVAKSVQVPQVLMCVRDPHSF